MSGAADQSTLAALRALLTAERRQASRRQAELMRRCLAAEAALFRLRAGAERDCAQSCPLPSAQRDAAQCARCAAALTRLESGTEAVAARLGYRPTNPLLLPRAEIAAHWGPATPQDPAGTRAEADRFVTPGRCHPAHDPGDGCRQRT